MGIRLSCYPAIIDTGADVSIMPKEFLLKRMRDIDIYPTDKILLSASGNELKVVGIIKNFCFTITNQLYTTDIYVTEKNPKYLLLGINFIKKNPKMLLKLLNTLELPDKQNFLSTKIFEVTEENIPALINEFKIKFSTLFSNEISDNRLCNITKHGIDTGSVKATREYNSRIPIHWESEISQQIKTWKENGIVQDSNSEWCSRIVPVKKPDGSLRLCIDYRTLNKATIKDSYPLPRIDEIIDNLSGSLYFSCLDMTSGYNQIAIKENDRHKTAFSYKNGLYEFTRMPFGLCNAPSTFQRCMDQILKPDIGKFVIPYLDDIIIYSKNIEEHTKHLNIVLGKIKAAGLTLNINKCNLFKKEIKILGHIISGQCVKPDPQKILAIKNYRRPENIKELRSFLGLCNYIRPFVINYAHITAPLNNLLKKESKRSIKAIKWTKDSNNTYNHLINEIQKITYRSLPDLNKDFILTTDASNNAYGSVLSQINDEGKERMIATFSKKMDVHQMNYSVTDKELLAAVKSMEHFKHYLLGRSFLLRTDHKSIEYLNTSKNPSGRFLRWALKLQEFNFKIKYLKGDLNGADGLSRYVNINMINSNFKKSDEE